MLLFTHCFTDHQHDNNQKLGRVHTQCLAFVTLDRKALDVGGRGFLVMSNPSHLNLLATLRGRPESSDSRAGQLRDHKPWSRVSQETRGTMGTICHPDCVLLDCSIDLRQTEVLAQDNVKTIHTKENN